MRHFEVVYEFLIALESLGQGISVNAFQDLKTVLFSTNLSIAEVAQVDYPFNGHPDHIITHLRKNMAIVLPGSLMILGNKGGNVP